MENMSGEALDLTSPKKLKNSCVAPVKKLCQTRLTFSNGKLVARLPADEIKEKHTVEVVAKLPLSFESLTAGAPSTDVFGFGLPPQIFIGWKFFLTVDTVGWSTMVSLQGVEYLIKLHGGEVIYTEEETDMTTIVVLCDYYGVASFWKNGRRVYTQFVIFDHIENRRSMTRQTLDNVPYSPSNDGEDVRMSDEDDEDDEDSEDDEDVEIHDEVETSSDDGVVSD